MVANATYLHDHEEIGFTAAGTEAAGDVLQLPDGRAGVIAGLKAPLAGERRAAQVRGVVTLQKTASINILKGGRVFWDRSANKAHFRPESGDFYIGFAVADSLAAATTVDVMLNEKPEYLIDFDGGPSEVLWTAGVTNGEGVTPATISARTKLSFDAVAEAAMAALYPAETRFHAPVADGPIFEARVAVYDKGDNAALDINFGLANGTHATDADSIAESVFFHLDGAALDINAESDDGSTEVAAVDTTVDAVDDTYFEVWIDCRDLTDIQLYIDGVNVLPATVFKLDAAAGPVFPLFHLEKTNDDTLADFRVDFCRLRLTDLAS